MRRLHFCIVGLSALALSACLKRNEFAEPPPPTVTVAVVEPRDVTIYDSLPGQTAAVDAVDIVARVTGFLLAKDFSAGATVEAGQLLFKIDPAQFEANLQAAEGKLASAVAERDLAETTYQRNRELFATQAISELDLLRSEADLDLSKGSVEQAQATVAQAQLDIGYTEVTSPIRGRISREFVTAGNLVGPGGTTTLARVVSMDPMYFYFNADERTLLQFLTLDPEQRPVSGQRRTAVTLALADGSLYARSGTIDYVGNEIDEMTGTIEIRALFPNPDGVLFPGLYGRVRFARPAPGAIVVPETVVQRDLAGDFVLVVNEQDIVETRYVKKGAQVEGGVILEEGLAAGERLIVNGLQRARPGGKVQVATAAKD